MQAPDPIRLVLVWHFHQPDYVDGTTGAPAMPWTRLHALKDYADMADHLERHPGIRATLNLVPTLIDQLEALGAGTLPDDPFLAAARKDASLLDDAERRLIVGHFFSFNRETMAGDLPRVEELFRIRGPARAEELPASTIDRFAEASLRDLQVLFHLAWCGGLLGEDPRVRRLREKGRRFTEEDKHALLDLQREFLAGIVPRWRRLAETGRVELSVTPYFHPILPLLCDLGSAHEALPGLAIPNARFRRPEDVALQLAAARARFREVFGVEPQGGWPSEGAISEASLRAMGHAGWRWAASDEDVLFGSLGEALPADAAEAERRRAAVLYRPWRFDGGPALLFRDHELSDRIGFVYASWDPETAAEDFVGRLRHLHAILPPREEGYTVGVILDGENAWEHYRDHGRPFFDALYAKLAAEPAVVTRTAAEAVAAAAIAPLPRVVAGSWIGRNLATWIGHEEKNRAWSRLAEARDAVGASLGEPDFEHPAWRAILGAEGSDWFWWYGDDHETAFGAEFDASFRGKLAAAYRHAGLEVPESLALPIRRGRATGHSLPAAPIRPIVDGRVTDYFEWLAAGRMIPSAGAMHGATRLVGEIHFGADAEDLHLRLDTPGAAAGDLLEGACVTLRESGRTDPVGRLVLGRGHRDHEGGIRSAMDRIVECSVPLSRFTRDGNEIVFALEIETPSSGTQRIPGDGYLRLPVGDHPAAAGDWFV